MLHDIYYTIPYYVKHSIRSYIYGFVGQELQIPGRFLEHAMVHGNLYGTSQEAVQRVRDKGQICILDVDVQGRELRMKQDSLWRCD